jgi:hypothetical protein
MANIPYHKFTTGPNAGEYMNLNAPGGPDYFRVFGLQQTDLSVLYFPQFSYDGGTNWFTVGTGSTSAATAQTQLDNFMAQVNAGTITS